MSMTELKEIVENATVDERQFLFVCLSEKLSANDPAETQEWDHRLNEMEAGEKRLSLDEFDERLDRPAVGC